MKRDAEENEKEDNAKREAVDTHNTAEQLIYQTEKQMEELGEKLDDSDKSPINAALDKLKDANNGSDVENIKNSIEELNQAWSKVSEKIYQANQAEANGATQPPSENTTTNEGDTIEDADFEVVDEEKN